MGEKVIATPAFAQWVETVEIAGPGFLNLSLSDVAIADLARTAAGIAPSGTLGRLRNRSTVLWRTTGL